MISKNSYFIVFSAVSLILAIFFYFSGLTSQNYLNAVNALAETPIQFSSQPFTQTFTVSREGYYSLWLHFDRNGDDFKKEACQITLNSDLEDCKDFPGLLEISWEISHEDEVVYEGNSVEEDSKNGRNGYYSDDLVKKLGAFSSPANVNYEMIIVSQGNSDQLNILNPKLEISMMYEGLQSEALAIFLYQVFTFIFGLISVGIGCVWIAFTFKKPFETHWVENLTTGEKYNVKTKFTTK